ncbi:MAG: 3-oxoacyl-ACP reductase FabG [Clostridia bacterium]|nr:3-oxoacyl-ACP reductase FabG [Clostridia bacterium]
MKTAIITGASRGIGRACALLLSKNGYNVLINYNRSEDEAKSLSNELGSAPHMLYKADISQKKEVFEMINSAADRFGGIDLLVNNAGIAEQKLFSDITEDDLQNMMNINFTGAFFASQAALPYMLHEKSGAIINISSMWGIVGGSCEVHYSASKAALLGFTKALAKELGPSGITVNAIAPGIIETDMMFDISEEEKNELIDNTPACRFGTPEDVAKTVLFLAENKFYTGQVLSPNGGFVIY